jgi:hypothetical protein
MKYKYLGPTTKKNPSGFTLSDQTCRDVAEGVKIFAGVSGYIYDVSRLYEELRETAGILKLETDYGDYEVSVLPYYVAPFLIG